jgi:hypothetical protein
MIDNNEAFRQALNEILDMDSKGVRADDLGRAARIARAALNAETLQLAPKTPKGHEEKCDAQWDQYLLNLNDMPASPYEAFRAAWFRVQAVQQTSEPFQQRVQPWMKECFGSKISADAIERNHRFLEESLELVQACDCTKSEAHQLVDYVFNRLVGDPPQEVGGVMVTLAALCLAQGLDMHDCGEVELSRIMQPEVMRHIREKQASKPRNSPLPESVQQASEAQEPIGEVVALGDGSATVGLYDDNLKIGDLVYTAQPAQAVTLTDEVRTMVLNDFVERIALGPNDEAAIGAYETLAELIAISSRLLSGSAIKKEPK